MLLEYAKTYHGKKVGFIGLGVSNTPILRLLVQAGAVCSVRDMKELPPEEAEALTREGVTLHCGETYLDGIDEEFLFLSPAVRSDLPKLEEARKRGTVLTNEMEEFFRLCPCPIIAVTGSDGKTTTTTLIAKLLEADGKTVHLGGNIGHPLLAEAGEMSSDDLAVLELSSFQLMTMGKSADKAIVTNLSPNHLDVHKDYREYVEAKENIFLHQTEDGLLILNADNEDDVALAPKAKGKVLWFSRQKTVENGAYLKDGVICYTENGESREVLAVSDIRIPGTHNIENYMAAIAMVQGLVSDETVRSFFAIRKLEF